MGNGFHVQIDSAETAFGDGVALVRMSGIARLNDSPVGAAVTVFGAIDGVQIDSVSGVLHCSVAILGVEARDALDCLMQLECNWVFYPRPLIVFEKPE